MKKISSLVTVMAMLSNAALAGPVNNSADTHAQLIAKAFNQFRYKMTVEVDPNTVDFQKLAVSEFKQKLVDLQTQGVAPAEIMSYMRSTILDASAQSDFDRLLASIDSSKVSAEEAGNLAMSFMANRYQKGANYSGGTSSYAWIGTVLGIVITGVVTYFVTRNNMGTNTSTTTETVTNTVTDTCTNTNTLTVVGTEI